MAEVDARPWHEAKGLELGNWLRNKCPQRQFGGQAKVDGLVRTLTAAHERLGRAVRRRRHGRVGDALLDVVLRRGIEPRADGRRRPRDVIFPRHYRCTLYSAPHDHQDARL